MVYFLMVEVIKTKLKSYFSTLVLKAPVKPVLSMDTNKCKLDTDACDSTFIILSPDWENGQSINLCLQQLGSPQL